MTMQLTPYDRQRAKWLVVENVVIVIILMCVLANGGTYNGK